MWHILWDGRVMAPRDDHAQSGLRPDWQQRGDTVGIRADNHAAVLIQAIYDQDRRLPSPWHCSAAWTSICSM